MSAANIETHGDVFRIPTPFYVSFSGGRTSGFMLRSVLDAYGGSIPDGGHVLFANTGREHESTLEFVREVGRRWCAVTWLEWRDGDRAYAVVDFDTASRNGEPFAALIRKKRYLPNPVARFCTSDLKVRTMQRYLKDCGCDPDEVTAVLGLRFDEMRRVMKLKTDPTRCVSMPLADAGITRELVNAWWSRQDFDLALPDNDTAFGNCDLCFLKARDRLDRVMVSSPLAAEWWCNMESETGGTFRSDRPTYRQMLTQVTLQGRLFQGSDDDTIPCDCTE
jgi:3'-phosphoadenosine 5'-phosphosulfate sulfotransferase (PAPS reductase)/FAD synthetase